MTGAGKPELPRPLSVLFDLDGTLLDGGGAGAALMAACEEFVRTAGARMSPQTLMEANRRTWETYWPEVEQEWPLSKAGEEILTEAWRRTLARCGIDDEELVRLAYTTHRRLERGAYRLFHDVPGAIGDLRRRGARLAVVTNGASDVQRDKLEILGLADRFDAVVISAEAGVAKPDPAIFHLALDHLETPPERSWHVGDNLMTDVAGARAAGIFAVWLNRLGAVVEESIRPDIEIRSLDGLLEPA